MDRAQEFEFVWALMDAAEAFLDAEHRVRLCVRIGAGEYRETIVDLLQRFTTSDTALPPALAASLWAWMRGFVGSDSETALRTLARRIRVADAAGAVDPTHAQRFPTAPLMPRRSERATQRLVSAH